jgi:hypothetical protein
LEPEAAYLFKTNAQVLFISDSTIAEFGLTARESSNLVRSIRSIYGVLLALFVLWSTGAFAGDFSLTYAIDANGKNDAGKVICEYDKPCSVEPVGFGISVNISFIRPDHRSAELEVFGGPGCCYSADANRTFYLDIEPGLVRVPLYEGRQRKGNEFVQNHRFGMLYLEFSNLR